MNLLPARLLTALHSRRWKARFGNEFEALLLELPLSPAVLADALISAIESQTRVIAAAAIVTAAALLPLVFGGHIRSAENRVTVASAANFSRPPITCTPYSAVPRKVRNRCAVG